MARHRHSSGPQARDTVPEENLGGGYWSVDPARWATFRPGFPEELADLLAPPIVVGVVPVPAVVAGVTSRSPRPGRGRHRRLTPRG
ncbi:hypothetical protein GCM10027280_56070 [Micromonospora polyrhachis]|uniref:Uncharacterized protein n=1 Tax=Micromonospora polyrhachis TaxID=1282883 RepID=A0A7W7WR60_9ACTN|nr:hypothetical protein [Micromonospora polyrhachis]MBB4960544.1 hypothetical protein [Micromonospora polyrhachis]